MSSTPRFDLLPLPSFMSRVPMRDFEAASPDVVRPLDMHITLKYSIREFRIVTAAPTLRIFFSVVAITWLTYDIVLTFGGEVGSQILCRPYLLMVILYMV